MQVSKSTMGIVAAALGALAIIYVGCKISAAGTANGLENKIISSWDRGKNELSAHTATIGELAQLPAMQRDDLKEVLKEAFEASDGNKGNQLVMGYLQQSVPQLDKSVYSKIAAAIEAGRLNYKQAQNELIAVKQVYRTELGSPVMGYFYKAADYPQIKIGWPYGAQDDFPVIVTAAAKEAYETGVDTPTKLR